MAIVVRGLFCDEIRAEVNGKYFIIGAYPGALVTYLPDYRVTLSTWVEIGGLSVGNHTVGLIVRYSGDGFDAIVGNAEFQLNVSDDGIPAYVMPGGLTFQATHDGRLTLLVSVNHGELVEASNVRVTVPAPDSSNSLEGSSTTPQTT